MALQLMKGWVKVEWKLEPHLRRIFIMNNKYAEDAVKRCSMRSGRMEFMRAMHHPFDETFIRFQ